MVRMDVHIGRVRRGGHEATKRSIIPRPFAPVGGVYLNLPPRIDVDPYAILVTAGERNGMNTGLVDNRNLKVALRRTLRISFHCMKNL
jgi:hypothetical protein